MALKYFKHKKTGEIKKSLRQLPEDEWQELMVPPDSKFMVSANKATRKSKMKDSEKILRARARNHSRDVDIDDNIRVNKENGLDTQVKQAFLNEKGERRRKIDDI